MRCEGIICPGCNAPMVLRSSKYGVFWGCSNFPMCRETHGAHPDGKPLGFPVDKETRELRTKAHKVCEKIWGDWKTITKQNKQKMYKWLKENTSSGHISQMGKDELIKLIDILEWFSDRPELLC